MIPRMYKDVKVKVRNKRGQEYIMKCKRVYELSPYGLNRNPQLYYYVSECVVVKSDIPELPKGKKILEAYLPKSAEIIKK